MADDKPIIVIKKKGGHGGAHGGAWKVAFADFMTAMMAFFLVMWLVGTADTNTKQKIAKYFKRPGLFESGSGTPLMIGEAGILNEGYVPPHPSEEKHYKGKGDDPQQGKSGSDLDDLDKKITIRGEKEAKFFHSKESPDEEDPTKIPKSRKGPDIGKGAKIGEGTEAGSEPQAVVMQKVAQKIRHRIQSIPELENELGDLEVKLESDGLVVEIMDTKEKSMFALSSARILPKAQNAFLEIAKVLSDFPNQIDVIGHTDAKPFSNRLNGYSNWELSSDRANAARKILVNAGIKPERILSVVGRADQDLKVPKDPFGPENRRISLKMRFSKDHVVSSSKLPSAIKLIKEANTKPSPAARHTPADPVRSRPKPAHQTESSTPEKTSSSHKHSKKDRRKKQLDKIKLPEEKTPATTPKHMEKDKIFGDKPIFGPPPIFSDF